MHSYRLADRIPDSVATILAEYPTVVQQLLHNRGLSEPDAAMAFLNTSYEDGLHDPFLMPDMEVATARIVTAIANDEHVVIYSDYDCDGIPGAVVLHDFFQAVGFTNFSNYIPHRHFEGFGFSVAAVEALLPQKPKLIITIDCGSTDHEAVTAASAAGIEVIITDHHEPKATLPAALAVVNPKVGSSYPFPDLCGAGVVFKLVQALIAKGDFGLKPGWEKWWLDMVGIATIADMVPLVGENRILASYGLKVLRLSRRPGVVQLLRKQNASQRHLTEDDIGFTIGPRLNAASRMDAPEDAFTLLATKDEAIAAAQVLHLEKLNNERKGVVAAMTREAHGQLRALETIPAVIVLGNPTWRPSLVGLVANKLAEEYQRPTFVWGRDGNGTLKGSARSDGTLSVIRLMDACAGTFSEGGGHHFSGGFSLHEHTVHTFFDSMQEAHKALGATAMINEPKIIDAELHLEDLTPAVVTSILDLGPFGVGNPKPVFRFTPVTPVKVQAFGKQQDHTKLTFRTSAGWIDAIAFFTPIHTFGLEAGVCRPCSVIAELERSYFAGRLETRLRLLAIEPA